MGYLDKYYSHLFNYTTNFKPAPKQTVGTNVPGLKINDAVEISIAEIAEQSKAYIVMHELKDYRQTNTSMILLPDVSILFDEVLKGSEYFGALLSNGVFNKK